MQDVSRRWVIRSVTAFTGSLLWSCKTVSNSTLAGVGSDNTFSCGIASGDPLPDGIILWTRVDEASYTAGKRLSVEISRDENFTEFETRELKEDGKEFGPARDFTASLDVRGLKSATRYYYRFVYGGRTSDVGRFKTLLAPNEPMDKARLAILTCLDYSTGYFNVMSHIADQDLDAVVHLGDFIYEYNKYPEYPDSVRFRPVEFRKDVPKDAQGKVPVYTAESLADYRQIYRKYRSDKHLQRGLAAHAWIIVWDDHEIADNSFHDYERDGEGIGFYAASPNPLALTEEDQAKSTLQLQMKMRKLAAQKAAARQAWSEYVPARWTLTKVKGQSADFIKMYRAFRFGNFLDLFMTDSRSFRTEAACAWKNFATCYDYKTPSAYGEDSGKPSVGTMLGKEQTERLINGLRNSPCTWKVWGNQTLLARLGVGQSWFSKDALYYANYDAWDGYQYERQRILDKVAGTRNFVVLTGDFHTVIGAQVKANYDEEKSKAIGFEFMTPSLTSPNFGDALKGKTSGHPWIMAVGGMAGLSDEALVDAATNYVAPSREKYPDYYIKTADLRVYGYSVLEFRKENAKDVAYWTIYDIDKQKEQRAAANMVQAKRVISYQYDPQTCDIKNAKTV